MAAKKLTPPKQSDSELMHLVHRALSIDTERQQTLEKRLGKGFFRKLAREAEKMQLKRKVRSVSADQAQDATADQNAQSTVVHGLLVALRSAIQAAGASAEVRRAYGVGKKLKATLTSSVIVASHDLLRRAKDNPEEARSFGILPEDLKELSTELARLEALDEKQQVLLSTQSLSSPERVAAAREVAALLRRLSAIGALHFKTDDTQRVFFLSLAPRTPERVRKQRVQAQAARKAAKTAAKDNPAAK